MFTGRKLRVPDRKHLWDSTSSSSSSSSNDDKKDNSKEKTKMTAKKQKRMSVDSSIRTQSNLTSYIPITLKSNSLRHSILPAFPTSIYDNDQSSTLLLANVPCML